MSDNWRSTQSAADGAIEGAKGGLIATDLKPKSGQRGDVAQTGEGAARGSVSEIGDQQATNSDKSVSGADIESASADQKMVSEVIRTYSQRLHEAFQHGDKNKDGFLTEVEITNALDSSNVSEPHKQMLEEMKENFKDIVQASSDGGPRDALTQFDMRTISRVSNELDRVGRTADRTREFFKENFSSVDKNGDGWLSQKELDQFIDKSDAEPRELGLFLKDYRSGMTDRATGGNYVWRGLIASRNDIARSDLDSLTVAGASRDGENHVYRGTHQQQELLLTLFSGISRMTFTGLPYFRDATRNGIRQFIDRTKPAGDRL